MTELIHRDLNKQHVEDNAMGVIENVVKGEAEVILGLNDWC